MDKLGLPHLAHLRAVARGIAPLVSATMYLPVESRTNAMAAHHALVDRARALGRAASLKDWRLIGLSIRGSGSGEGGIPGISGRGVPTVEAWAAKNGYEDWSEADLLALYCEVFPLDRKQVRDARLRQRQEAVIASLETAHLTRAKASDPVRGWFDHSNALRLENVGLITLGDLQARIARNRRWWTGIKAVGAIKAARVAGYVASLFPDAEVGGANVSRLPAWKTALAHSSVVPEKTVAHGRAGGVGADVDDAVRAGLSASGAGYADASDEGASTSMLTASTDGQAIEAWIAARANSPKTAISYRKELRRLYLWSVTLRNKTLSQLLVEDCSAYKAFLAEIPEDWMGAKASVADRAHWVPFATQLSAASQRQAVVIANGFFVWALSVGYVQHNPWAATSLRVAATQAEASALLESRAFTKKMWAQIVKYFEEVAEDGAGQEGVVRGEGERAGAHTSTEAQSSPKRRDRMRIASRARLAFICEFCEATGLRSSEVLAVRLEHFRRVEEGLFLSVVGKGGAARSVAVPGQAQRVMDRYLATRALPELERVVADRSHGPVMLIPNLLDENKPVGYTAFYTSVKRGLRAAIQRSTLTYAEKTDALKASPHWLRHTFGTRASERGVSKSVLMVQFGHADERPTSRYSRAQRQQMSEELGRAFG
jgi:integrase